MTCYLTVPRTGGTDQSLRGHLRKLVRELLGELLVLPVNVPLLFKPVVDPEQCVGFAAHRTVSKQRSNEKSVLNS